MAQEYTQTLTVAKNRQGYLSRSFKMKEGVMLW